MKIFKRKEKKSEGHKFLKKLNDAVRYNHEKVEFEKLYNSILMKAENPEMRKPNQFKFNPICDVSSEIDTLQKPTDTWFNKFKFKINEFWDITKEFGSVVKNWFIAEYRIVRRLGYALSRKTGEIKVRNKFEKHISSFTNQYGYEDGIKRFNKMASILNDSAKLHKKMTNKGYV